jgi:hypothetical protein
VAFFSAEEGPKIPTTAEEEMALSPAVQTVLDQILELNMVEIAELSHAIQVYRLMQGSYYYYLLRASLP